MGKPFHEGEIAVQERAGGRAMAEKIGRGIHGDVPPVARVFLREQHMVVVASASADGSLWASLLAGAPGFVDALDDHTVTVDAQPAEGDPLADNLRLGAAVGLLAIDFATRRRVRVNGTVAARSGRGFAVRVDQLYGNCPKYIQRREVALGATPARAPSVVADGAPTAAHRAWIESADTFFIATAHAERGADASHRGGNPGFVRFAGEHTLRWPDYAGNMMFQTLGNLFTNPAAGLLFLDFARGATLQLSGKARIVWDTHKGGGEQSSPPVTMDHPEFAGAERLVELEIERVIETERAFPAGWRFVEYSPANPPVP